MRKFLTAVTILAVALFAVPAFAAAATNPFMDVPANHWAYDAISQLASRGVISGYPDGSFKGPQPATRYEMASIVARALAKVDMEKASKPDVEMLKKLIVEFKDELDALGVKTDKLDSRLGVMEKDLGGWSMAGELRFDAKFSGGDSDWYSDDAAMSGKNEFDLNRYRFWIRKRIDENTSFTARLGSGNTNNGDEEMQWEHYYITTKLPYDITLDVGRYNFDWEGDLGLYNDNDAWMGDITANLFHLAKSWGKADLQLVIGRNGDDGSMYYAYDENTDNPASVEQTLFAARLDYDFGEKFRAGLLGYYFMTDENPTITYNGTPFEADSDYGTYGAYFGFKPTPSIEAKGLYYYQTQDDGIARYMSGGVPGYDDSASAWKAIIDVKQDALKFTGLWLEYGQIDNNFLGNSKLVSGSNGPFANSGVGANPYAWAGAEILRNQPNNLNTTKIMLAYLPQQWNDKWRSYLRYVQANFDTSGLDDATGWTVGVAYRLNPSVEFELAYDAIDYGDGMVQNGVRDTDYRWSDDNIVRFRTYVTF